jgi:hypothetical protein
MRICQQHGLNTLVIYNEVGRARCPLCVVLEAVEKVKAKSAKKVAIPTTPLFEVLEEPDASISPGDNYNTEG